MGSRPARSPHRAWRVDLPLRCRVAQYTAIRFTEHLALEGISPSIGSVGDAYDNALMETINGADTHQETLGSELVIREST